MHDATQKCLTEGCDGVPFFGETASLGYCDSCHIRRCDVEDARQRFFDLMERMEAETDEDRKSDLEEEMYQMRDDWPELRTNHALR